ncbi:MAG TPA: serine hydrolase domain-containing protein [Thermomicrobiales bacterium]|nr:serine hydrolase domain-containing protein [Thermomicrobiales bacterium]
MTEAEQGFDTTGRLAPLQALLDRFVAEGQVDGAAVAVAQGGAQVAELHAGNAAPGRVAATDTLWPLASISKVYTAAVVMALVEQGQLTLSMTARSVLPEFDGGGRETITIRQLMTHTSGIVYESPEMEQRLLDQLSLEEIVDEAYTYPLLFTPGTRLSYSDYNFALLGRIASVVAGQPFPNLVRELVLEPGKLGDTFMPPARSEYQRLARVVEPLAYGTESDMYNSSYALDLAHPAFGTVATVGDLLRFGLLFAPNSTHQLFSAATIQTMASDQTGGRIAGASFGPEPDAIRPWGLGFMVKGTTGFGGDLLSPATFGHGGASGCVLQVDPVTDIAIAYVSNKHARTGREAFTKRQISVCNVATAALTRD